MLLFYFGDSLTFSNYFKNSSNFFSNSNISYGYKSADDSWNGNSSGSEVYSIYRINNTNTITEGERLFSDSSSFSSNNTVISSDDSTNWSHPLVFNNCRYLSAISLSDGIVVWQKILYSLDTCGFTVSSNLTVKDHYYVIGFSNYRMWIINRDNGQQLYNEYGIISPVKILESGDNKLYYLVKAGQQTYALYELVNFNSIVSVKKDKPDTPDKFLVMQNYPNPFNPSTIIKYSIPKSENVILKIYDVLGRQIQALVNEQKPAGNYQVEFDGSNLPSSVYFYQIRVGSYIETRKMLLLK